MPIRKYTKTLTSKNTNKRVCKYTNSRIHEFMMSRKSAFSLVEALLAITLFALIIVGLSGALFYGPESTRLSVERSRAIFLAEEGLEAVRNIRDEAYTNLTDGTHGIAITGNQWTLSGTYDQSDIFTRTVTIVSLGPYTKEVISTVTWQQNAQRAGQISLKTRLTEWTRMGAGGTADDLVIDASGAVIVGGDLQGITFENIGTSDLIIDKITVYWVNHTSNLIERVRLDNRTVWNTLGIGLPLGEQPSGTELDISDVTISAGETIINNDFQFDTTDMYNDYFTIVVELIDGTTKQVVIDFTPQAGNFVVNTAAAVVNGNTLEGLTMENVGVANLIIDKITVSWAINTTNLIETVKLDNRIVWSNNIGTPLGRQPSGTELDIEDFMLVPGGGIIDLNTFVFDGDMPNEYFTILFTLNGGLTKEVVVDLTPSGAFEVDASVATVTNDVLSGIVLRNGTSSSVIIDKVTATWEVNTNQQIEEVRLGGTSVWNWYITGTPDGRQVSGTELDIEDFTIDPFAVIAVDNEFIFDGDMEAEYFTLLFTLGDSTTREVTINLTGGSWPPPTPDPWTIPNMVGIYNTAFAATATNIFVAGSTAYLTTNGSGQDLYVLDISTHSAPTLLNSLELSDGAEEVVVSGDYAYLASHHNTQELQIIDVSGTPSVVGYYDKNRNNDSSAVAISGTTVFLGTTSTGGTPGYDFYVI
ncbi:MAG: hypothetical protein OEL89_04995, partial [Candidatus Peregrinibacteria bacterium]|nr:hypothetical protein [Candidatus Peregrinibacteria bacterium]